MTITIDIETILYGGTAIMLTLSITIVLMVYFFHKNLMHYQDDTFFKTITKDKKVKKTAANSTFAQAGGQFFI